MTTIRSKNCMFFILVAFLLVIIFVFYFKSSIAINETSKISRMEEILFERSFPEIEMQERVLRLENSLFKQTFSKDTLESRIKRLDDYLFSGKDVTPLGLVIEKGYSQEELQKNVSGYENVETKEVTEENFLRLLVDIINEERSFMGLLPLVEDTIAGKIAQEQAYDIALKGYLTHFNLKNQGPDERYTLAGGTGALTEIIKGFQVSGQGKGITLTTLLAKQLVQAIKANSDDVQLINSPQVTHIGVGCQITSDKKAFASVMEFVVKGGDFEPLKPTIFLGEKLDVQGRINKPYKFKAISVGYLENVISDHKVYKKTYFDNESLGQYFPPQEYIAYGDTGKSNIAKVVKGLGVIGAIGAAPFTGGASAVLAPVFLSSLQSGPPREIPLKGGIKAKSNGEFYGNIDLNYQGMSGLYFVNVLAERDGINYPLVISRRTVGVIHQADPVIGVTNDKM